MNSESLGDKYRLIRLIGTGGMGSVYEAVDVAAGHRVAIKVLHESAAANTSDAPRSFRRLDREARALRTIDIPHIVRLLDAGAHPETGAPYLVMELLEGEDLQQTIDRLGPLPPPLALRIVAQACLGLHAAHKIGVVHRDIKPANLFLARHRDGEIIVKIVDFGIAKLLGRARSTETWSSLTTSGGLLGSPLYMSPEQLRSAKRSDHRTDLWSIGAVLYCALTGRAPCAEIRIFVRLIAAICSQPPPPLRQLAPWVSPEIARIVEGAMVIDPSRRFPSALAMLDALRPLLPDGFVLREEAMTPPYPPGSSHPSVVRKEGPGTASLNGRPSSSPHPAG